MKNKLYGLVLMGSGAAMLVGAVIVWVMWLTFCFGTVIVGLIILFMAPALLMAPLVVMGGAGLGLLSTGTLLFSDVHSEPVVHQEPEQDDWATLTERRRVRAEQLEKLRIASARLEELEKEARDKTS